MKCWQYILNSKQMGELRKIHCDEWPINLWSLGTCCRAGQIWKHRTMIWLSIKFEQYVKENSTAFLWNVLSKHLAFQESLLLINGLSFLFRLFMVLGFQYWHWYPKFSELEKKKNSGKWSGRARFICNWLHLRDSISLLVAESSLFSNYTLRCLICKSKKNLFDFSFFHAH